MAAPGARPSRGARAAHGLPLRLTSFVGRERERAEIGRLLGSCRLVTLVGAPGVGKTRLALQVAAELSERFQDGTRLIELAGLAEPALVPAAVATALGVAEQGSRPMLDTLIELLHPRSILLLLDNCEHLIGACAELAEALLQACPGLQILATSREALRIDGETTWRVPSLASPTPDDVPFGGADLETRLARIEAVQLFLDRARAVQPGFRLTEQNADAVAQICRRLDGIPLAIELAAARLDGLSAGQIAARLDDHFSLLTAGSRTALPRQQTLRGAVDWSYALLPESERRLLRHLAVFAGGWTLEAADAVGGASVLEPLLGLVGRSLVVAEERASETRYRLLEMIRQYGWEKLAEAGALDDLRDRHRDWLLVLVERIDPFLDDGAGDEASWLAQIEAEHDNVRAALLWTEQQAGAVEVGLRLSAGLWSFWWTRGHMSEGRRWLDRSIAQARASSAFADRSVVARALGAAAQLAVSQGDVHQAVPPIEEALSIWHEDGNAQMVAWGLHRLSFYLSHLGQLDRALTLGEESVARWRDLGGSRGLLWALQPLANLALKLGDYHKAVAAGEEALALARALRRPLRGYLRLPSRATSLQDDDGHGRSHGARVR